MRKLVFTFLFALAFFTANQTQAMTLKVDCFEMAIEDLEEMESVIGVPLSDYDAMIELNTGYAACECVYNGNCYPI